MNQAYLLNSTCYAEKRNLLQLNAYIRLSCFNLFLGTSSKLNNQLKAITTYLKKKNIIKNITKYLEMVVLLPYNMISSVTIVNGN